MSVSKFESEVKFIPQTQQAVYDRFADLNNLASLKERLNDPEVQAKLAEEVPADKLGDLRSYTEGMTFDTDSLTIASPLGQITLRIVERDEPKCIKFETEQSPIPFNFWIQLLPVTSTSCKMKLTIKAELNMFIKQMVKKPLQEGIEKIADVLQMIQYN